MTAMDRNINDVTLKPGHASSRNVPPRPIALALQGSGTHGAFSWGVLDRLLEDGRLDIRAISATGGAAMNAVIYACCFTEGGHDHVRARLEKFWRTLSRICAPFNPIRKTPIDAMMSLAGVKTPLSHRWFDGITQILGPNELNPLNYNPFSAALESAVDLEIAARHDAPRIALGATNVRTGRRRTFTNRDCTLDAVLASACVPTLFHAVEIDGEKYWDGGHSGGPSILPLLCNSGTRDVLLARIQPVETRDVPQTAAGIRDRIGEIALEASLSQELQLMAFAAKLVEQDWVRPEHRSKLGRVRLHAIHSGDVMSDLTVALNLETDWRSLQALRDHGRHAAELWLETHFDHIGVRSTFERND
jgi:NTE family protein